VPADSRSSRTVAGTRSVILPVRWIGGAAEIVMLSVRGDLDRVGIAAEAAVRQVNTPAGHFADEVAAFARAASIYECGETAIGVSSDVVDVPYGCVTEGITASLVTKPYQVVEQAVEIAPGRIASQNRPSVSG
jgi:hypothetical protein